MEDATIKISPISEDTLNIEPDTTNTDASSESEETESLSDDIRLLDVIWNEPDFAKDADLITMEKKMKDAAPYNIFFTTLEDCPETKEQLFSISFTDLLCPSLGKLKSSLHITFEIEINWVIEHKLPMTILHGNPNAYWPEKDTMEELYPNIDYHYIKVKQKETDLGCHHSKISFFLYEDDTLRVVIGSGNLYSYDWEIYNQQLWISPSCPKLPEGSSVMDGESPTGFKFALFDFLSTYEKNNIPSLQKWMGLIKNADFSDVKVALLFSFPGVHYPRKNGSILHYLGHLLSRDCVIPAPKEEHNSWRIVAQTASLGLIGRSPHEWLTPFLLKSLGSHKDMPYYPTLYSRNKAKFSLIYPSVQNILNGYLGADGGNCICYEKGVKNAQPWLLKYNCQWKADETKRSRAAPHLKSYCRISPCWQKMAYYFLTSANLSRSAWGKVPNDDSGIYIRSYEIGVLFLPKFFGEEYFEVKDSPQRKNEKLFPVMFDLPLTPYGLNDDSYCREELIEQGIVDTLEETNDTKDNSLSGPAGNDGRNVTMNKWDQNPTTRAQAAGTQKEDMKYSLSAKNDMFFPSFNKKS